MRLTHFTGATAIAALAAALLAQPAFAEDIPVGHLADQSGPTSDVGVPYAKGVADALAYVNSKGGVAGRKLAVETVDYGYQVPRAIAQYKKWSEGASKIAALQGWGTADTEALISFVTKDQIPDFSASYSAALTDPTGKSGKAKPAPYNFFYGPSYSDALRALLTWAAEDWKAKGGSGKPKFVHMGANHPYPNSPKEAGEAMAKELGFDVIPPVQFAMTPGDYTSQCLTIKNAGANYAYLANTAGSNISVLKACKTAGVEVQFMGNVWGMDENAAKAAGDAANGMVFPVRTGIVWNGDAPGMATLSEISKMSGSADTYRPVHYHGRGMLRHVHGRGDGMGGGQWRRDRPECAEGHVPEEGLGSRRHGRRLPALDLDGGRPSRADERQHLPHECERRDRRRCRRAGEERHDQDGQGEDHRASAQAGYAGLVGHSSALSLGRGPG